MPKIIKISWFLAIFYEVKPAICFNFYYTEHLEKVIPLVVKFSRVEDDELREYCLQAFKCSSCRMKAVEFNLLSYWLLLNLLFFFALFWFKEFVICCTSRQAGHRIGEHLEKVIPLVVKFSRVEDDELREYCLQAFESFVRRCPKDISTHIPMVNFTVIFLPLLDTGLQVEYLAN